ncbi:ABC transporter substrate-binding protein [Methanocalculus sp.]|uniref:ABC transporter substrate-binding protein n=1 Tax=Methanocalculus sp. TaxID=2004547 RepID=UPI00271FFAFD|nr:ABC transporter substrate-binding protein [Methanocalculus sp.]MDO8841094.1 ABC transporter substrate-binding protein [Methanocalculus sp.]
MKRLIIIIVIALAFSVFYTIGDIPGDQIQSEDPYAAPDSRLSLLAILPLTGDDVMLGSAQQYSIRRGMIQSQDHPITLHFADSQGDPEIAVNILLDQMERGIIQGLIVSGREVSEAIIPYAEEYGIPMAIIAAPIPPQEDEGKRYIIRFTPPIETEISTLEPFLADYTDIAVLYPDTEEGMELATLMQDLSKGRNVRMVEYNQTDEDFSALIRPLQAMPPEIYIIDGVVKVNALISAIKSRGANPVILVSERSSIVLRIESPHLAEGVFVLTPSMSQSHPLFSEDLMMQFKSPISSIAEAFDAANTLSSRISSCNGEAECVVGWYWNREYEGALGNVCFDEERRATYRFEIVQIRNRETESVKAITAPPMSVYILIDSGSKEDWFIDEVKRGIDPALSVINSPATITLPLAMSSGIPSLFDAQVTVLYDREPPDKATVIGKVTITPDGRTTISADGTEPQISIGIDNEAYITRCFTIPDIRKQTGGGNKTISILSNGAYEETIEIVRTTANSFGYTIGTDLTYQDEHGIRDAISTIMMSNPDAPLFVSAGTPHEASLIIMESREAGYAPDAIFTIGDAWRSDSFIRNTGLFSEGIMAATIYRRESVSESQTIRDVNSRMVRQTGREVNDISARAFTGIMMIAEAAERGGDTDPFAVSTALQQSRMTTEYGALYDGSTYVAQIRSGVYRIVQ